MHLLCCMSGGQCALVYCFLAIISQSTQGLFFQRRVKTAFGKIVACGMSFSERLICFVCLRSRKITTAVKGKPKRGIQMGDPEEGPRGTTQKVDPEGNPKGPPMEDPERVPEGDTRWGTPPAPKGTPERSKRQPRGRGKPHRPAGLPIATRPGVVVAVSL